MTLFSRSLRFGSLAAALACIRAFASPVAGGGGGTGTVVYTPVTQVIQGTDPFTQSYTLTVTSPTNLTGAVSVPLSLTVLSAPLGISNATAIGFISLSPSTLTFTGPSQVQTTVVTLTYPLGNFPGNYSYQVSTSAPSWGVSVTDPGATVNAVVAPATPSTTTNPPVVTITSPTNNSTYYYYPLSNTPATIPVQITATTSATDPVITALTGSIGGTTITSLLNILDLNSFSSSASYNFTTTTPGTYVVGASAMNAAGTGTASTEFTVAIGAPPPTVTASSPAVNANYTFTVGAATGATVGVSFTGVSAYGDITALSATLDGAAVAGVTTTGVGSALTATGTVSLTNVAVGGHNLVFTAVNAYGQATTSVPFTVTSITAVPPTITISSPVNGAKFSFESGGSVSVPYTITGAVTSGTVTSLTAQFGTTALAPTITGLNTASVTATGALTISAAGTYTISATDANAAGSASAGVTFTVTQVNPSITGTLYWLPPVSCGQTVCGGSVVPISFDILQSSGNGCRGTTSYVTNTNVVVAIIQDFPNGTSSTVSLNSYSSSNSVSPNYTIISNWGQPYYLTQFTTATGANHYHIEVYLPLGGSSVQVLGQTDIYTTKSCAYSSCHNGSSCYQYTNCASGSHWNGFSCGQSSGCFNCNGTLCCNNSWNDGYCWGGSNWYADCWGNYSYWGNTRNADQGCDDSSGYTGCNGWGR